MSLPPETRHPGGPDPRPRPSDIATPVDSSGALRPAVASVRPPGGTALIVGGAALLGVLAFAVLSTHRDATVRDATTLGSAGAAGTLTPPPPPPADLIAAEVAGRAPTYAPQTPGVATLVSPPIAPPTPPTATPRQNIFALDKAALARKSPALVVDLAGEVAPARTASNTGANGPASSGNTALGATLVASQLANSNRAALNGDEQFAARVSATELPETARATMLRNTKSLIPQGAMIPGVLETALNSDLPGFARAVVSRDVRSFDGSSVLIPRGSRVIGQYKSAVALGQSRAFVIWTRIIRPDGASIQIGSSGTDPLGRAGLEGKVDRHFFERFGGSILLSVINVGVASLARTPSTQVVIGSSAEATNLGAQAVQPTSISPTIKVAQGAAIRIFVARDLDFSTVASAGQ